MKSPRAKKILGLVRDAWRDVWGAWNRFWFESNAPVQMRYFRSVLGWVLFIFYLNLGFDLELYFSNSPAGMFPLTLPEDWVKAPFRPSLFHYFTSDAALWSGYFLYLASLLGLALGRWSRASAIVAYVLHVSFMHRALVVMYGIDLIASFYLLYLCFAEYGERSKSSVLSIVRSHLGSMAFRLSQIQVCIIYGFSGLEKLKGAHWWRGEAIWDVLANSQIARFDFSWVSAFPMLIVLATWTTLIWEIYFPVLIWAKRARPVMLFFGVLLHFGIGLTIGIPFFAAIMICTYTLFCEPETLARTEKTLRKKLAGWTGWLRKALWFQLVESRK